MDAFYSLSSGHRHSGPQSPRITTKVQLKGHFCFCLLYMNITVCTNSFDALFPIHNCLKCGDCCRAFCPGAENHVIRGTPAQLQTAFRLKYTGGNLPVKLDLTDSFQQSSCVLSVRIQLESSQLIKKTCQLYLDVRHKIFQNEV